jgi:dCTP deaminase
MNKSINPGTLDDRQITDLCSHSVLINENFSKQQIKQACYELRAGNVYYDLTEGNRRYELKDGQEILVKPRHMTVIITFESLNVPPDILGRVISKGSFFSLGLSPVNTFADPGFEGRLGIVTFNSSSNYLRIPFQTPIAKIEFSRLIGPVSHPYAGQHGFQTSIWPIRQDLILTAEQVRRDYRYRGELEELRIQHGEFFGELVLRIFRYERRLLLFAACFLAINLMVLWILQGTKFHVTALAVALGIISNLATALITLLATGFWTKWRK